MDAASKRPRTSNLTAKEVLEKLFEEGGLVEGRRKPNRAKTGM